MSRFCLAEIATLIIGWFSGLLFLFYSAGVFAGEQPMRLLGDEFRQFAAILAFPYVMTFLCCWILRRFMREFLLLSLLLTIGSTCVYYGFFVARRPLDGGWIFVVVPMAQTAIALSFSLVVFLLGLVFKPKVEAAETGTMTKLPN